MQEWINQAEEDYLERDFTYKTPEELRKAVEELKVCKLSIILRNRAVGEQKCRCEFLTNCKILQHGGLLIESCMSKM